MQDLGENEDKIYARLLRSVQATPSVVDIQNKVCIIHGWIVSANHTVSFLYFLL